jgi:hypothetical protein
MPALDVVRSRVVSVPPLCSALLVLLAGCNSGEQPPVKSAAKAELQSILLREFALPPHFMRLSIGACQESCPVQVELLQQGQLLDTHILPVAASGNQSTEETVDEYWGADPGLTAWAIGEEESYVSTTARLVQVAPGTLGLLLTQRFGFEHVKRAHVLLLVQQGKLVPAWEASEAPGPHPTTTLVAPDGKPGFVFVDVTDRTSEESVDVMAVSQVFQAAATAKPTQQVLPRPDFPLYLLHTDAYSSASEARGARDACLAGLWVLDGGTYRQGQGAAFLGALFTQRKAAEQVQQTIAQCDPNARSSIDEYSDPPQQ